METDQILSRTSLKPTAPEFVPSGAMEAVKEVPAPDSPEDSDDDVHVVLRSTGEVPFLPPPMQHRDTADSFASTDSERSVDSPVRDKDDSANLGDRSDSGSDAGASDAEDRKVAVSKEAGKEPAAGGGAGADDDLPPFEPPDEELSRRIVDQVEFYFSDVNITKDAFLLKHVKRNKEGYVSLKLISSFKRVKHIARDWRVVAHALKQSTKLEINEAGTKLRRVDPLPAYDQTTPSRTVVAINLPHDKPTIESVAELFRCCGDIALVRILRPGNPIPADVRAFVAKHPEMHGVVSALVEFVRTESALAAVAKRDWDWRYAAGDLSAMRVLELNAPPATAPPPKKRAANKKNILGKEPQSEYASGSEAEAERYIRSLQQRRGSSPLDCQPGKHWLQRRYSRDSGCEDGYYGYHRAPSSGSLYGSGSEYSRSRSNSAASFDLPLGTALGPRRMSAGWDSGSESCCSGRSSRSNSAAFILDGVHGHTALRRCSGKDSDSDGYGSFRSRKSSGGSDLSGSRRDSGASNMSGPCYLGGRRGSGASTGSGVLEEEVYLGRRGSGHHPGGHHLEHQLLRRMAALGLGGEHHGHGHHHHHDCCSCSCSRPPPLHDLHHAPASPGHGHGPAGFGPRRGSGDLSRKPAVLFAAAAAAAASAAQPGGAGEHTAVRRLSGAGVPENIMRMPRGPDGGRGFTRENDIPEVC
ncbi:La-related protein 6 [Frankliniella fusca]|uniref:La-related protein 6 n=1 Tax=Frankliniella fusca TaxID=407009 RepID=A0AAE1LBS8_9NEOP|nr:La-related protein 6 [Frankliniella fusca]